MNRYFFHFALVFFASFGLTTFAVAENTSKNTTSAPIIKVAKSPEKETSKVPEIGSSLPSTKDLQGNLLKGIAYCLAILVALLGIRQHLKNRNAESSDQRIQFLSRRAMGHKAALVLVEVDGNRLLLSQTPEGLDLISELHDPFGYAGNFAEEEKASDSEKRLAALK